MKKPSVGRLFGLWYLFFHFPDSAVIMEHQEEEGADPCDDFGSENTHFETCSADDDGDDHTHEKFDDARKKGETCITHTLQCGKIDIQEIKNRQESRHDAKEYIGHMLCFCQKFGNF